MILLTHALVGASVANILSFNPVVAFGVSLASHYLIDAIPHRDYGHYYFIDKNSEPTHYIFHNYKLFSQIFAMSLDIIASIILCSIIFFTNPTTIFITLVGIAGGILPDFLQLIYHLFKKEPMVTIQKIHHKIHASKPSSYVYGIFTQVFVVIIFIGAYLLQRFI
ncbi:MAG: hypothetical protein WCC74_03310 [Minisyncoccia bacterium]